MKNFKFILRVPNFSKEKEALGILFQTLTEMIEILTKEKNPRELGYFFRERLGSRERRVVFHLLNEFQTEVGQKLNDLKGRGNLPEGVTDTCCNEEPLFFFEVHDKLTSLDNFDTCQSVSSEDIRGLAEQFLEKTKYFPRGKPRGKRACETLNRLSLLSKGKEGK